MLDGNGNVYENLIQTLWKAYGKAFDRALIYHLNQHGIEFNMGVSSPTKIAFLLLQTSFYSNFLYEVKCFLFGLKPPAVFIFLSVHIHHLLPTFIIFFPHSSSSSHILHLLPIFFPFSSSYLCSLYTLFSLYSFLNPFLYSFLFSFRSSLFNFLLFSQHGSPSPFQMAIQEVPQNHSACGGRGGHS